MAKQLTTFVKDAMLNEAFGKPEGDITNRDDAYWERLEKQYELCIEELAIEMREALDNRDIIALADAQGDLTVVNDGIAHLAGFDADAVHNEVDRSNNTKFCADQESVDASIAKYAELGFTDTDTQLAVAGDFPYKFIKVVDDITVNGKFYPKDKFLKSVSFEEPNLHFILK